MRVERMTSPAVTLTGTFAQSLDGFEETLGFRLTPELTLRAGHRARRIFGRSTFDQQVAVSAVWWRRWN
jgi:hypothetical protein